MQIEKCKIKWGGHFIKPVREGSFTLCSFHFAILSFAGPFITVFDD